MVLCELRLKKFNWLHKIVYNFAAPEFRNIIEDDKETENEIEAANLLYKTLYSYIKVSGGIWT